MKYSIFIKDTEGKFHVLKTYNISTPVNKIKRVQSDYIISELYVQIENTSDDSIEADIDFTFTGKNNPFDHWRIIEI